MAQPRPWLTEIKDALKELGGHGTLHDITERITDRGIMDLSSNSTLEETIRRTIYNHTSVQANFKGEAGGVKDIFYPVHGKGKGHWGLRNYEPTEKTVDLTEDDMGFEEGKKKLRQHIVRERNPQIIKLAKERFKEKHGKLFCEICTFDFYEYYGEIGEDFIEGHHTKPVSELQEGEKTKVEDIALVCSNCHKILHRRRPWLKKEELMKLINR
ncbi:HNH endonuclease [Metabacillus sp. FJAT-53654]|uniref:HNH endonuclease n=1 Tax=Metabacillus rhizosphaerae TaxID=3117747 RepID=A0ABZ2MP36_9BACI